MIQSENINSKFKNDTQIQVETSSSAKANTEKAKEDPRIIFVNDRIQNKRFRYCKNSVRTTKYTLLTFVPQNLFEQFCRLANLYFLLISILQLTTPFSPTGRFSTIIPLICVVTTCMLKDGYEDWKRRVSDFRTNNKKTRILKDGQFIAVPWHSVQVGDMIRVENNEPFPADILVFSTSEPQGLCYVETSSLDGETNLKIRRARTETLSLNDEHSSSKFKGVISCEKPNKSLYKFEGNMQLGESKKISLDNEQILLRGCTLKNTRWIIGTVVFTGHDSKLMKNQKKSPFKQSKVAKKTNKFVLILLAFLVFLCFVCTICVLFWVPFRSTYQWYTPFFKGKYSFGRLTFEATTSFITFLILFNNLIPISLYVSVEIAKLLQGWFITQDIKMYHEETDTPANVQCSSLNEELGQVQYIFSDKTGTLTCNMMEFLKFALDGVTYGTGITEIAKAAAKREDKQLIDDRPPDAISIPNFRFYDSRVSNLKWVNQENRDRFLEFFTLLGVCHTVIPEGDARKPDDIIFQASSPDEAALVTAAQQFGVKFHSRTPSDLTVEILGQNRVYQVLNVCEFNSTRKRMSVVVRTPEGKLILYCKGADTVIYQRLKSDQLYSDITLQHLETFANEGLRTLVCAKVELDESTYLEWNKIYEEAKVAVFDRAKKLDDAAEMIEKNLELVGVTAIEDKLQDGVPDAIAELANAGIRIWVLTGDKQETAINIGFACDLLNNQMAMIILEGKSRDALYNSLKKNYEATELGESQSALALIVDGQKLEEIYKHEDLKLLFLKLGIKCKAVICCRVSPAQKADVVTLVRDNMETVTLAIGDGANDVAMIQAAHVGVGISGLEGLQAANSSDYAIAQFKFLKRLLLVHGRWSYRRVSRLILYSFYKNTVLYLTQMWFVIFNGFSGTSVHDKWTVSMYNIFFTSLPIMALSVFDYDLNADSAEQFPELYIQGHKKKFFNTRVFVQWMINSIFHSALCFFIPLFSVGSMNYHDGKLSDMYNLGITIYTCVVFVVTAKVAIETSAFTWVNLLIIGASIVSWFAFIAIYASIYLVLPYEVQVFTLDLYFLKITPASELLDIMAQWRIFTSVQFWCCVFLTTVSAISRDYAWKVWKRMIYRKLYYDVQSKSGYIPRKDIMKYFPMEEGVIPQISEVKMKKKFVSDFNKMFSNISGRRLDNYRGFAFSELEKDTEFLEEATGKPHKFVDTKSIQEFNSLAASINNDYSTNDEEQLHIQSTSKSYSSTDRELRTVTSNEDFNYVYGSITQPSSQQQ